MRFVYHQMGDFLLGFVTVPHQSTRKIEGTRWHRTNLLYASSIASISMFLFSSFGYLLNTNLAPKDSASVLSSRERRRRFRFVVDMPFRRDIQLFEGNYVQRSRRRRSQRSRQWHGSEH